MGLTYCVQRRREQGLPIDGPFARAEEYTEDYRRYAWTLQNPDGSFSTKWFEGRAAEPDMEKEGANYGAYSGVVDLCDAGRRVDGSTHRACLELLDGQPLRQERS